MQSSFVQTEYKTFDAKIWIILYGKDYSNTIIAYSRIASVVYYKAGNFKGNRNYMLEFLL